jgi:hypothetical protein
MFWGMFLAISLFFGYKKVSTNLLLVILLEATRVCTASKA